MLLLTIRCLFGVSGKRGDNSWCAVGDGGADGDLLLVGAVAAMDPERGVDCFPDLVSSSEPGEESVAGFGEYGQVSSAVGWLLALDVNVCGLKIAGEAVHEGAGLAGDQVLGLFGIGLFV